MIVVQREMGCTRAELLQALERMLDVTLPAPTASLHLDLPPGSVHVEMAAAPPRRVGSLVLPVLRVQLTFADVAAAQADAFLARFEAYTHRGGG